MSTYGKKLKDPRWQKLRLEVMNRDGWACQWCGSTTDTLNVHHLDYAKSGNPWDVPIEKLLTLCEDCHSYETFNRAEVEERLLDLLRSTGFLAGDLYSFMNDVQWLLMWQREADPVKQNGRIYASRIGNLTKNLNYLAEVAAAATRQHYITVVELEAREQAAAEAEKRLAIAEHATASEEHKLMLMREGEWE
jgi:hypothetical protein